MIVSILSEAVARLKRALWTLCAIWDMLRNIRMRALFISRLPILRDCRITPGSPPSPSEICIVSSDVDGKSAGSGSQDAISLLSVSPLFQAQRTVAIRSPRHVNETLWQAMPLHERTSLGEALLRARRFEPADARRFQIEPDDFGFSVAIAAVGSTRISASVMRRGMAMTVLEPGLANYTFGMRLRGSVSVSGIGRSHEGSWGPGNATFYREQRGARIVTSDDHAGIAFELPYARIATILEQLIERPIGSNFRFAPALSLTTEPGRSVARVVAYIEQELSMGASLLSQGKLASTMEDLLIRTLLIAQPHGYSGIVAREAKPAAPFNVSRAEAFMHAHADEAIDLERLVTIAGGSVRSLQAAFRRWRGTSPMEELRRIRLDCAHRELRGADAAQSVSAISVKFGFSNLGRFTSLYRARFGQSPSETRRKRQ